MAASAPSQSSSYVPPELPPQHVTIHSLPSYFPTSTKKCTAPTTAFFTCFEEHAVMRSATDSVSPKFALQHCQRELVGYMKCVEACMAKEGKPWWKVW